METIRILNPIEKKEEQVSVIRYFLFEDEEYLVYCHPEEIDRSDRINVYVTKLRDKISITILDSDWGKVYQFLRMIGFAKKESKTLEVHDLKVDSLNGIILKDYKILSLKKENLKYFLKEEEKDEEISHVHFKEAKRIPNIGKKENLPRDYQALYHKELEENVLLKKRIEDLENLTLTYELNFKQIQKIIDEKEYEKTS